MRGTVKPSLGATIVTVWVPTLALSYRNRMPWYSAVYWGRYPGTFRALGFVLGVKGRGPGQ